MGKDDPDYLEKDIITFFKPHLYKILFELSRKYVFSWVLAGAEALTYYLADPRKVKTLDSDILMWKAGLTERAGKDFLFQISNEVVQTFNSASWLSKNPPVSTYYSTIMDNQIPATLHHHPSGVCTIKIFGYDLGDLVWSQFSSNDIQLIRLPFIQYHIFRLMAYIRAQNLVFVNWLRTPEVSFKSHLSREKTH